MFQIAIDGPVAAGKGTVSRLVAERLGFLYVDTGAMYRATALLGDRAGVKWDDELELVKLINAAKIEMRNPTNGEKDGRLTTILLDGEDVSWQIRTEKMGWGASSVAVLPAVREALVKKQQQIAESQDVVMEGRDITYRVLPKADLKIFLTASDAVRAKRRQLQLQTRGKDVEFEEVYAELIKRDQQDMTRVTDPLKIIPKSWVLDTSELSIEEAVIMIVEKVQLMREESSNESVQR
ncbi:MAG TPA: (d)CMP kinase [Candidatus Woesebacteria bacterium]|nr:(d)CMP kinase [Candidatus Woesebacteria bacterium]